MSKEFKLDDKIEDAIKDTFLNTKELELELLNIEWNFNERTGCIRKTYLFKRKGSLTTVEFDITNPPKSICYATFSRSSKDFFDFNSYLTSIKSDEKKIIHANFLFGGTPELEEQYIFEYLKLTKKYLLTTLRKVARGEEWLDISLDWGPNH